MGSWYHLSKSVKRSVIALMKRAEATSRDLASREPLGSVSSERHLAVATGMKLAIEHLQICPECGGTGDGCNECDGTGKAS
jgi:hypothetical protein